MKQYYIGITMLAATLAATSCSDFDDYNEVPAEANVEAAQSLWESISSRENLSEFASLVKKSGYDKELSSSHFYTVWAPLNGTIDSKWAALDSATLRFQFVENHIADYNHYISAPINERIRTINEKRYTFAGTSEMATFDNVSISKSNIAGINGVMHIMDGEAVYRPSIYEYFKTGEETNALSKFIIGYENETLDEENSVLGPIVDGLQTYEDSVMITTNAFLERVNAQVENEDSSYTIIMPTNEAWDKAYDEIKSNLNYGDGTIKAKCHYMDKVTYKPVDVEVKIGDAAYQTDSLTKKFMTDNLIYSNTNDYNKWLVGNPGMRGSDTLRSTNKKLFSHSDIILAHQQGAPVKMSNGEVRIVDEMSFLPWEWYKPVHYTNVYSAYQASSAERVTARNLREDLLPFDLPGATDDYGIKEDLTEIFGTNVTISLFRPKVSSGAYNVFYPAGSVRSTTYRVYCVIAPPDADKDYATYDPEAEMKQTLFNASISYFDPVSKKVVDHYFLNNDPEGTMTAPKTTPTTSPQTEAEYAFFNDMNRIDAIYLGNITFPVSYYGLQSGQVSSDQLCLPVMKITAPKLGSKYARENYARVLRIAGIILLPTELSNSNE